MRYLLLMLALLGPGGAWAAPTDEARAELTRLEIDVAAFGQAAWVADARANARLLVETKAAEIKAIEERAIASIQRYQDAEASVAALCLLGQAYLAYADLAEQAPMPPGLDPEEQELYRYAVQEQLALPLREKAASRLQAALDLAEKEGLSSPWVERARRLRESAAE